MQWHRTPPYGRGDRAPFVLIVAITACGTLGMHLIIPALPETARALGVSAGTIQLTITLYLIGLAIGQLLYGPVSDRLGRRPVLLAGLMLFTLAGIATTAAPNAWTLVIARILQSIGACAGLVLGRAIVRDAAAPDRATAQLAMLTLVMSAAPAIAPVLGGYATAWIGWRAAFALLAIVGAVTLAFAVLLLPETNALQSSPRASLLLGSLRLFRSRGVLRLRAGWRLHHHVVLRVHGGLAVHPGQSAAPADRARRPLLPAADGGRGRGRPVSEPAGRTDQAADGAAPGQLPSPSPGRRCFMLADLTGWLNVVSVIAPIVVFMVGAGMASPFALTGAVSVNPHAIGAASGLYGFTQMAYGALCTVIVEVWRPGSVFTVAVVLLVSALLGQAALSLAVRRTSA